MGGNVLFNDTLNTFYLRLYGVRERWEEMFYLMTHSTHFIYGYMASEEDGRKFLFNDTLNTFYLQLYAVRNDRLNCVWN